VTGAVLNEILRIFEVHASNYLSGTTDYEVCGGTIDQAIFFTQLTPWLTLEIIEN
jgi:hypothetical protein